MTEVVDKSHRGANYSLNYFKQFNFSRKKSQEFLPKTIRIFLQKLTLYTLSLIMLCRLLEKALKVYDKKLYLVLLY